MDQIPGPVLIAMGTAILALGLATMYHGLMLWRRYLARRSRK